VIFALNHRRQTCAGQRLCLGHGIRKMTAGKSVKVIALREYTSKGLAASR